MVGVWIAASGGQGDSGFAHLGPPDPSGISYPIDSAGTYSYQLLHGGAYAVHVGCGGSAKHWASRNYSPLMSGPIAQIRCDDPIRAPARGKIPRGTCTAQADGYEDQYRIGRERAGTGRPAVTSRLYFAAHSAAAACVRCACWQVYVEPSGKRTVPWNAGAWPRAALRGRR